MKIIFSEHYQHLKKEVVDLLENFDVQGKTLFDGKRNEIKVFNPDEIKINIKGFKRPNVFNVVAYSFFRKSKAQRSYEYAHILLSKGILTPAPIAYAEVYQKKFINRSFYASEHLDYDFTFRDVNLQQDFPDRERILREFTRFTYHLHENDVEFLDHSPGNTLVKVVNEVPQFYLIDLNRMKFHKMDLDMRLKNFSRLTTDKEVIRIMANEYSQLVDRNEQKIFNKMLAFTLEFQEKRKKKKALKQKFKSILEK